jgi:hypothetical protein
MITDRNLGTVIYSTRGEVLGTRVKYDMKQREGHLLSP